MIAYLVVREGNKWRDVYRLTPGQVMTVGRASTNRIVLHDEVCSRNHCEIFQRGADWVLRDLDSRNGTLINGLKVEGDIPLEPGHLIQIGACDLAFTFDLSQAFPQVEEKSGLENDTSTDMDAEAAATAGDNEPEIIHRRRKTRFAGRVETVARERHQQELAVLYRLAMDMGAARGSQHLADVVLNGLLEGTSSDIGALLLLPHPTPPEETPGPLTVVAYKANGDLQYQQVSRSLSSVVLKDREAILARDVADDSRLVSRDSLGRIQAKSVICSPIRMDNLIYGLIHLYSTNPEKLLEEDDLEFTLAVADQAAVALHNLRRQETLAEGLAKVRDENLKLREQIGIESDLVGDSKFIQSLNNTIARVAPTDAAVLIRGESGVGKELVARAIHFSSKRRSGPFVCMNCAALTESLLESELFGHEKGSFTGATGRKIGKFEQAHRGTLFLDEVGEMSLAIQAKFLRVLEGHPFERVGGSSPIQVDVRVVAATNRNLETAVESAMFRKDLYFRLHVVEMTIEPLREHPSDIPILAAHFVERFAKKSGRAVQGFTPPAIDKLTAYDWPGNVRELQNTVERAVILCAGEYIGASEIQLSGLGMMEEYRSADITPAEFRDISLEQLEQQHILSVLDRTHWNKSQASQILGIERSTLDRKLKRYGVERPES
ncbi:MAG: sigma 54-interacting transcriptional regulator [Planctomycetales bacterium]|nr:sigma 54-interacting transcriptional regulator [Planctomycetales bacterium]